MGNIVSTSQDATQLKPWKIGAADSVNTLLMIKGGLYRAAVITKAIDFRTDTVAVKENAFSSMCRKIADSLKSGFLWEIFNYLANTYSTVVETAEEGSKDFQRMTKVKELFYSCISKENLDVSSLVCMLAATQMNYTDAVSNGKSTFFDPILKEKISV